jgi:hypothetical protein
MASTNTWTDVAASREVVLRFASDPALLAEWNNEYIECGPAGVQGEEVMFRCRTPRGDAATWTLKVSERVHDRVTHVDAMVEEDTSVRNLIRYPLRWPGGERRRTARLARGLARLKGFAEAAARDDASARRGGDGLQPGDMVALLNVYTTQFGSYTTLLWQVPALGLTAQAFLMTIVLGGGSPVSHAARYTASALSIVVALASTWLMHNQRARAINHAELAKRVSYRLSLTNLVGGSFALDDAVPALGADAQNVWAVNRVIYHIWAWCMYLFLAADLVVISAVLAGTTWFT